MYGLLFGRMFKQSGAWKMCIRDRNTIVSEEKEKAVTRKIGKEKYILDYSKLSNDWMVVHIIPVSYTHLERRL